MVTNKWPELICTAHSLPFAGDGASAKESTVLTCASGCRVPVIRGIPRFVDSENYAAAFGLQWNAFSKTQLDSYTGLTLSKDRLAGALGASLDSLRNETVLEVGCGAGRFTEVMLAAGARVFACDLSSAVEANYANSSAWPNYFICQADARAVPVAPHSFDFVVCLGVIQHTPSPEETIAALARYVKPGGALVIDHYGPAYPATFSRRFLRSLLLRLPQSTAKKLSLAIARVLLPLHKLGWNQKRGRWRWRRQLQRFSPLVDHYEVFPELGEQLLSEWALLDTHDTLTDYYKHLRSPEEIEACLRACGLVDLEVSYGGNGVEARGRMPEERVEVEAGARV
jgi:2-polyprenyl-3-methyl-5-hydroxy-6-metoxy-1,4-benzoquinol methylase